MSQHFASIWYATPERIESMTKFVVFSDRGSLDVFPDRIEYKGKESAVSMRSVTAVSLTGQQIPWVTYAIVNVPVVGCLAAVMVMMAGLFDAVWDEINAGMRVALIAAMVATIIIMIAAFLFGLLIAASTKWVAVEYQDESNQSQKAYFADGSLLGWGGIFGGTRGLYHRIKQFDDLCHSG
jgi:hypothetical protein